MFTSYEKKIVGLAILALLFALVSYSLANNAQTTADNNANITNVFEIIINNTNLAPSEIGHPGTGERITGVNYTASLYPLQLLVFSHADTAGQISEIHIFVNGTQILDISGKPLGAAEQNNKSLTAIIPKDSIYMVEFSNTHHYEWREYPILSGRNGTLSINQTITVSGTDNHYNLTNLNWSVAGHILDSDMHFTQSNLKLYSYGNNSYIDFNSGINIFNLNIAGEVSNINIGNNSEARNDLNVQKTTGNYSNSTEILQNSTEINFLINETSKLNISNDSVIMNTTIDMQNNTIINYRYIDNGSYDGDGTTNRFIPYSLNQKARNIDIISNLTSGNNIGKIMEDGYIYNIRDGTRVDVTVHNNTGFFVSDIFNLLSGNDSIVIGSMASNATGQNGIFRFNPITNTYPSNLINIGTNIKASSGNIRMAIYNDSGGSPNYLINQTASTAMVSGWNNFTLTAQLNGSTQYWLGVQVSSSTADMYYVASGTTKYYFGAYGSFPTTLPALTTGVTTMNMEMTVDIQDVKYYWTAI